MKQVISNDIEQLQLCLNKNYIENHLPLLHVSSLIDELNQALHVEGFIISIMYWLRKWAFVF
ncbi:hypothetical protein [Sulfurospirillum diekertiae]|uniref:hypothetical protein n=1 Tax=Sulfurospirillum diekertiae TaxID=1854492 RepID=UPI001E4B946B|nr:hypothetical protein [Sulfurospirillum diekertiae]